MSQKRLELAMVASLAGATFGFGAFSEEKFQRLSSAQIRAKFSGMELTDEVHWYDYYNRNGTVLSSSMGRKRTVRRGDLQHLGSQKEVFTDLKHIARSAQYHTLLSMTKMAIPAIIQKASADGTVFSVKEKVRNGKPVFEVMTIKDNTVKTTFYDLMTGNPIAG